MSTTDDTNAARRGSGSNGLLGLVERLRGDAYALPSCGPWIERGGSTLPNNSCSQAADEIERLRALLADVADQTRHPDYDWPLWLCKDVAEALKA